ncbi:MAG: hypothetical protein M1821_005328 [Bathelium mastoideum]|nr:MAG: hypothetical protein M1821_005328 [Bathelium mastoideum]KAI9688123.1 MAG: hypothetical protein M1822_001629 [Bathelium mastoideum]
MSCDACRIYHYKCDDELPTNSHADSQPFPKFQVWLGLPHRVDFVDETPALEDEYAGPGSKPQRQSSRLLSPPGTKVESAVPKESTAEGIPPTPLAPALKESPGPITTAQDALLIRHFVDKVSHYFDFCDPKRQFALVVPQRARNNSTLACAILAVSARHLSRTEAFDPLVADLHYHRCCKQLIPALADSAAVTDDCLLAATVILRFLEELDVPITGDDLRYHLHGTQAIVRAQEQQFRQEWRPSGLREAGHWAAYRQDIYMALSCHRPMQLSRMHVEVPISDTDEGSWANLAVLLCGDVLQFAYGKLPNKNDAYSMLWHRNEDWRNEKPESFEPFYSEYSEDGTLPKIKFFADWHVMGHMYNYLAHLLLVAHDPNLPRMGPNYRQAESGAFVNARNTVLVMAGIARSNPSTPAAMLVASMAIAMFGDLFDDFMEQKELFSVLEDTELVYGWPTDTAQQRLEESWHRVMRPGST